MDMGFAIWVYRNTDPERVRRAIELNEHRSFLAYQRFRRVTGWLAEMAERVRTIWDGINVKAPVKPCSCTHTGPV